MAGSSGAAAKDAANHKWLLDSASNTHYNKFLGIFYAKI
jgi:hypothetical protein